MNNKHYSPIVLAALVIFIASSANAQKFLHGLTIEAGGGYSQLFWRVDSLNGDRKAFSLSPNVRMGFNINLGGNINIYPFTGYNRFGGKSDVESNGYYDYFWFNVWETGLFGLYQYRNFRFGPGLKYNRHLKVYAKYYGTYIQSADSVHEWTTNDWSSEFPEYSYDLGLRVGWRYKHCTMALDSWFGLSNLGNAGVFKELNMEMWENHYRLLAGFEW
jgi:hypothetical protein